MALTFSSHLTFTLVLVTFMRSTTTEECPTECFCPEASTTITCIGDGHLTSLPLLNLTSETTAGNGHRLEIRDYFLPQLILDPPARHLFFRQNVTDLVLAHNQIQQLVVLDLLQEEPSQVTVILTFLDLSNNNLSTFTSWSDLATVKSLDLSLNSIVNVTFIGMINLESLNLRGNSIQILAHNTFESLQSLHYINLDSNHLQTLGPHLFSPLPSLAHLILSNNPIELPPNFILNSRSQFIDLSHLNLTIIPPSLNTNVRDLRLNNNRLKVVAQTDFESFPNLGLLVLDENDIEFIEDDALGRLEFLTGLWINGNRLTKFPQNLPPSLKSLQLEDNVIQILNQSDFSSLNSLETLNLNANQLQTLDPDTFAPLARLRTLMLRSNALDSLLPSTFTNLSSLQILDLSQNPLKVIVNGAFDPLGSHLNVLHISRLGSTQVQFDPTTLFTTFNALQILDMSYSPHFCQQALGGLSWFKALRELNIDSCDLTMTHVKVLCDQIMEIESLKIIKGAGNPFALTSTHFGSLSVLLPIKICPVPSSKPITPTGVASTAADNVMFTKVSLTPSPSTKRPHTHSSVPSPGVDEVTSSYFQEAKEVIGNEGSESRGGVGRDEILLPPNEDRDEQERSIDGYPALTTTAEHHLQQQQHALPQKMLLQSAHIPNPSLHLLDSTHHSNSSGTAPENLILRTILISATTCLTSVLLLLGLALILFRVNGGRISASSPRIESARHKAYERLQDKTEVELGISNRIYFTTSPQENTPQVYTIS